MRQVLFHIPLHSLWDNLPDIPIYGYGAMLFLAFVFCTWLAARLAQREGIAKERIQDLAIWIFLCGILGARITFALQYHLPLWDFFKIWDGGLVFYGSAIGGTVGYFLAYYFFLRKYHISNWKMVDMIAPCAAVGLCLGRVGCLLNGCCFGNVACPDCPHMSFPLSSPPRFAMVAKGHQTAAGFTLPRHAPRVGPVKAGSIGLREGEVILSGVKPEVVQVEPGSPAEQAGLRPGDLIRKVNDHDVDDARDVFSELDQGRWPRGKNDLQLTVQHPGSKTPVELPPFEPWTIGLHPTQIYESTSMALLFCLLMAYYPFRRRDGEVMVLFMLCYAVHRFFNEMLRDDTDKVAFNMTLSQNISVLVLLAGLLLAWWLWRKPVQYRVVVAGPGE